MTQGKRLMALGYLVGRGGAATRQELRAQGFDTNSQNSAIAAGLITYDTDGDPNLLTITDIGRIVFTYSMRIKL